MTEHGPSWVNRGQRRSGHIRPLFFGLLDRFAVGPKVCGALDIYITALAANRRPRC